MISVWPSTVREDASALVVYLGKPSRPVQWTLTGGGTLAAIHTVTTDAGVAAARYTPAAGSAGTAASISVLVAAD